GLLVTRSLFDGHAAAEPDREMFVESPTPPSPESASRSGFHGEPGDITPVSLSMPTSERYVQSSRQVVTQERPFTPRIVYVTSTLVFAFHLAWLALAAALVLLHKHHLVALRSRIVERLGRRPDAAAAGAATRVLP